MKKVGKGLIPISLGILLTNFDFTRDSFGRFDLLPDFIGYGLIALGLGSWIGLSKQFAIARLCAWVLIPIAVIRWLCPPTLLPTFDGIDAGLTIVMIWTLLVGVKVHSVRENQPYLVEWSSVYRVAYVGLFCVLPALVLAAFSVLSPPHEFEIRLVSFLVIGFFWIISPFMIVDLLFPIHKKSRSAFIQLIIGCSKMNLSHGLSYKLALVGLPLAAISTFFIPAANMAKLPGISPHSRWPTNCSKYDG